MTEKAATIRIAGVVRESIVDGPGIRFTVFAQGCARDCKGCHNPGTHDFSGGGDCEVSRIMEEVDKNPLLAGVTFSGGEPFSQPDGFLALAKEIKTRKLDIVAFTGYTLEELETIAKEDSTMKELLSYIDLLIDGPFIEAEKDLTLQFHGSRNQRVIDMNATRRQGRIVLWESENS